MPGAIAVSACSDRPAGRGSARRGGRGGRGDRALGAPGARDDRRPRAPRDRRTARADGDARSLGAREGLLADRALRGDARRPADAHLRQRDASQVADPAFVDDLESALANSGATGQQVALQIGRHRSPRSSSVRTPPRRAPGGRRRTAAPARRASRNALFFAAYSRRRHARGPRRPTCRPRARSRRRRSRARTRQPRRGPAAAVASASPASRDRGPRPRPRRGRRRRTRRRRSARRDRRDPATRPAARPARSARAHRHRRGRRRRSTAPPTAVRRRAGAPGRRRSAAACAGARQPRQIVLRDAPLAADGITRGRLAPGEAGGLDHIAHQGAGARTWRDRSPGPAVVGLRHRSRSRPRRRILDAASSWRRTYERAARASRRCGSLSGGP